jgi:hypothetical protein
MILSKPIRQSPNIEKKLSQNFDVTIEKQLIKDEANTVYSFITRRKEVLVILKTQVLCRL